MNVGMMAKHDGENRGCTIVVDFRVFVVYVYVCVQWR